MVLAEAKSCSLRVSGGRRSNKRSLEMTVLREEEREREEYVEERQEGKACTYVAQAARRSGGNAEAKDDPHGVARDSHAIDEAKSKIAAWPRLVS